MSNGESKIAISKAALCYGFAIALRALFLGILRFCCHCENPMGFQKIKTLRPAAQDAAIKDNKR